MCVCECVYACVCVCCVCVCVCVCMCVCVCEIAYVLCILHLLVCEGEGGRGEEFGVAESGIIRFRAH